MPLRHTYKPGEYLVVCDICGTTRYRSECRLNYKNQLVCADRNCYTEQHPQEFVRGLPDLDTPENPRPPGEDKFLSPGDVTADDL